MGSEEGCGQQGLRRECLGDEACGAQSGPEEGNGAMTRVLFYLDVSGPEKGGQETASAAEKAEG